MTPKTGKPASHTGAADTTAAVDAFMRALDHPFKAEIEAIRQTIRVAHRSIAEGVKWNAPSFRTTEYFATTNLREKAGVGVILHLGAKVKDRGPGRVPVDDPRGLLKWLATDRAMVVFTSMDDINAKRPDFERLIRSWIAHV